MKLKKILILISNILIFLCAAVIITFTFVPVQWEYESLYKDCGIDCLLFYIFLVPSLILSTLEVLKIDFGKGIPIAKMILLFLTFIFGFACGSSILHGTIESSHYVGIVIEIFSILLVPLLCVSLYVIVLILKEDAIKEKNFVLAERKKHLKENKYTNALKRFNNSKELFEQGLISEEDFNIIKNDIKNTIKKD